MVNHTIFIQVTEPTTKKRISLRAIAEQVAGASYWRIHFPQNNTLLISQESGQWKVTGETSIDPDLLNEIGKQLHPLAIAQVLNRKRLDKR